MNAMPVIAENKQLSIQGKKSASGKMLAWETSEIAKEAYSHCTDNNK